MNLKDKTIDALYDMVETALDELAGKGELKTKDEVCLLKELLSAHEKLEKEQEYANGYSQAMPYPRGVAYTGRGMGQMNGGNGNGGYSRDGWYITREDDYRRHGGRGYSYGEPDVDRITEAVRMAMRGEG